MSVSPMAVMTSPRSMPASSAGPSSTTLTTATPSSASISSFSASRSVTFMT